MWSEDFTGPKLNLPRNLRGWIPISHSVSELWD